MLVCGQEEPLQINEYIATLDEATGNGVISREDDARLNRYSFVWLGASGESDAAFARLVLATLELLSTPATWVATYSMTGEDRVHKQLLLAKRVKEGWAVYRDQDLAIAAASATNFSTLSYRPVDELPYSGLQTDELLLFLEPGLAPTTLAHDPARSTLQWFAAHTRLFPSKPFLNWLAQEHHTVIYRARSYGGHRGLVVVGTLHLPTEQLLAQGVIKEIKSGSEAGTVWAYPPSYHPAV